MRLATTLAVAFSLTPAGALGQEPASTTDPAALFDEGVRLCSDGQFAAAIERFRSAHMLRPHPTALENIARCAVGGRDWVAAIEAFEELDAMPGDAVSPERRAEIRREIADLRRHVGRLRITGVREGASLSVDGRSAGTAPLPRSPLVTAGTHVVEARMIGFEPRRAQVEVPGGGEVEVSIDVGPRIGPTGTGRSSPATLGIRAPDGVRVTVDDRPWAVGSLPPGPHRLVATGPGGVRAEESFDLPAAGLTGRLALRPRFSPLWALAAGAVGVAAGGVALVTWSNALDAESRYNDPATPRSELESVREEALDSGHVTDILVATAAVAGAAALALGAIWALDESALGVTWEAAE